MASRKLYRALAADLFDVGKLYQTIEERNILLQTVDAICDCLKRDNSRFDRQRFLTACGMDGSSIDNQR